MNNKIDATHPSKKIENNSSGAITSGIDNEMKLLLEQFKNGNDAAFEVIYAQWFTPIYNLLKRLTGSAHDAEDIAQDVFCTLWKKRNAIDTSKDIKAFIISLARNNATDHLRKGNSAKNYLSGGGHVSETDVTPHDLTLAHQIELLTEYAIRTMPEERRRVFLMNYKDGLKPAEIAEKLEMPRQNVYDHLRYARDYLARIIPVLLLSVIVN